MALLPFSSATTRIGSVIPGLTAGSIPFGGTSGALAQDNANFFWDDTNNRLGIGTTAPGAMLQINANAAASPGLIVRAAASQTANLQEWQGSDGTILSRVGSSGHIRATAGELSVPGYAFNTDTDTGMWLASDNNLGFQTGGLERVRIDGGGNVGIGTTAPGAQLEVKRALTATAADQYSLKVTHNVNPNIGAFNNVMYGGYFVVSSDTALNNWGASGEARALATFPSFTSMGTANIPTVTGLYVGNAAVSNGSITNQYGVRVEALTSATNNYGLYFNGTPNGGSIASAASTHIAIMPGSAGNVGIGETVPGAKLHVNAGAAGTIGQIIRGAASQTANLQEWQNSAGTALLSVGASGHITLGDAVNIITNATTGTKIGTATTQKIGFFNATPVVQQATIVDADGTLADITTKFNSLLSKLESLGLLASA